jgi:hypothetical protein
MPEALLLAPPKIAPVELVYAVSLEIHRQGMATFDHPSTNWSV